MTRTDIANELIRRGYRIQEEDVIKNGVVHEGIVIRTEDSEVTPIIYTDPIIKCSSGVDEAADRAIRKFESDRHSQIDIDAFMDPYWVLNHMRIGLQRKSNEAIIRKETEFEGIEQYLMVAANTEDGAYCYKIPSRYLSEIGVDEAEAWDMAMERICKHTKISHIATIFSDIPEEMLDIMIASGPRMYVVTTEDGFRGASAILNRDAIKRLAAENEVSRFLVLPSSVHEMIIIPHEDDFDIDGAAAMVKDINETEVTPEERLTDMAYTIEV